MAQTKHVCPKPAHGMLPFIIHDAAVKGNVSEVVTWLENGGDINAADMNDQTLVFTACDNNHVQLLKELLKRPKVHLNQCSTPSSSNNPGMMRRGIASPLITAISKGHMDCVESLIASPSECKVELDMIVGPNMQASMFAARQNQWRIVEMILKTGWILEGNDTINLMGMAVRAKEMNIVKDLMKESVSLPTQAFKEMSFDFIFQEIYKQNLWDDTNAEELFKKMVLHNNDMSKGVLHLILEKKDWNRLETLLKIMNDAVKINVSLAEAVLGKLSEDVERLLAQEPLEDDVMNGTLLVASIGGTSEQIVDMLFVEQYNYSAEILDNTLSLACLNSCEELLPSLFRRQSFNYSTLCRVKKASRRGCGMRLIQRALKKIAQDIIPINEDDENDSKEA